MKNSVEGNRLIYWDNLKAILIFCVCLGHVLLPVLQEEIVGRAKQAHRKRIHTASGLEGCGSKIS